MSDPKAASPAHGAASKTDSPQNPKESAPAEKPARFCVVRVQGLFYLSQQRSAPSLVSLSGIELPDAGTAEAVCALLNELDAERRGDNPADVQRQLLEELRELVKLQRDTLTKHMPKIEAAIGVMRGETKRPEPNVNDLMMEVGRAFGLSDLQTMNLDNLKGFCCAAWRMSHVPQRAARPLLLLVVRGALDASADEVSRARESLAQLGLA